MVGETLKRMVLEAEVLGWDWAEQLQTKSVVILRFAKCQNVYENDHVVTTQMCGQA
jgi:hypothetical protein